LPLRPARNNRYRPLQYAGTFAAGSKLRGGLRGASSLIPQGPSLAPLNLLFVT